MKLSIKACTIAVCLVIGLAGCASKDEEVLVLPDIDNKVSPDGVWSTTVGDGIEHFDSHLKPTIVGETLFVASRKGIVSAFNLADGNQLWSVDIRDGDDAPMFGGLSHWWNDRNAKIAGGIGAGYDKIYIGTEDGEVIAFNPQTGERVWSVHVPGEVLTSPVAGEGFVFVNTGGGRLYALQPDTGEQRWMHESENSLLTLRGISEVVPAAGGVIYGSGSGKVGVLIADKGVPAWEEPIAVAKGSTDLARIIDVDATPIVQNGTIYAIAYNGQLVAMELRSGRIIWKRDYASFRSMTLVDGVIYLVDSTGKIYGVDAASGTESWSQSVLNKHNVTGPVVYKNFVVIGDDEGNLHWFNRQNGEYMARHQYDGSGFFAEGISTADYLIVQSRNGEVEVLRVPE